MLLTVPFVEISIDAIGWRNSDRKEAWSSTFIKI
jgi:hypothetical protein